MLVVVSFTITADLPVWFCPYRLCCRYNFVVFNLSPRSSIIDPRFLEYNRLQELAAWSCISGSWGKTCSMKNHCVKSQSWSPTLDGQIHHFLKCWPCSMLLTVQTRELIWEHLSCKWSQSEGTTMNVLDIVKQCMIKSRTMLYWSAA